MRSAELDHDALDVLMACQVTLEPIPEVQGEAQARKMPVGELIEEFCLYPAISELFGKEVKRSRGARLPALKPAEQALQFLRARGEIPAPSSSCPVNL